MSTKATKSLVILVAAALSCLHVIAQTNQCVRNARALSHLVDWGKPDGIKFDITATVTFPVDAANNTFAVEDSTGHTTIRQIKSRDACSIRPGDRIRATGVTRKFMNTGFVFADTDHIEILAHGKPPTPKTIGWNDMQTGKCDNCLVRVEGTVRDAFRDEIDGAWYYLQLQCGQGVVYACFRIGRNSDTKLHKIIDADVSVVGLYTAHKGLRRMIGQTIYATGWNDISIIKPAPANPFAVPDLSEMKNTKPADFNGAGRRKAKGRVIAVWHGDHLLLRTADGSVVRIDLSDKHAPNVGDFVEAAGNPETDLYRLNLSRAIWRPTNADKSMPQEQPPADITVAQLTTTPWGKHAFQTDYHGKPVQIKGQIISLPKPNRDGVLTMECDGQIVPVDASSCPNALDGVETGCTILVAGTCLMETANWHPNAPFPHIEGFSIIMHEPDDIRILSRPPWWTPSRLLAVIGALLGLLTGIFAWNRMLNRRAEKRGRELADERLAHVTSDLKVYERTRLAVELHDSISQNLTGVSLAIRAANKLADSDQNGMRKSLALAARTLDSCRDELRNCLWDLRNQTLEENDMNEAIRQTLAPHIGNTKLSIRFNVPRDKLSDNTTHSILRIIRELATNAIRHGNATTIKVVGTIENDKLLFFVADNGCGFNPQCHPDSTNGHFGLQGIQDRVDAFEGTMNISSSPESGTKVTISIKMKGENDEGQDSSSNS